MQQVYSGVKIKMKLEIWVLTVYFVNNPISQHKVDSNDNFNPIIMKVFCWGKKQLFKQIYNSVA